MKFSLSALTAAVLITTATLASAQNVAIVNGKAGADRPSGTCWREQIAASGRPVDESIRAQLKEEVVLREIFMQEAQKRGMAATEEFKNQMANWPGRPS